MNTLLDIVGSMIIAAMVLVSFTQFMTVRQSSQLEANHQLTAQMSMRDISEQLHYDLRKIGYQTTVCPILQPQSGVLAFLYDANNDNVPDTIRYWLGEYVSATENPSDRFLCRRVNQQATYKMQSGVVNMDVGYFTASNQPTSDPTQVKTVQVMLSIQSPHPSGDEYPGSTTTFRVSPKNIR